MKNELVLFVAIIASISCATFDRARDCTLLPLFSWCHCAATIMDCARHNMTQVPTFGRGTNWFFKLLDIGTNDIRYIPALAFDKINVTTILLNNNKISFIDPEAFGRMKNKITTLNLEDNRLITLPEVIGQLTNLQNLNVKLNPIDYLCFTDTMMRELGDHLKVFHFGDTSLTRWPSSLHHLEVLEVLHFFGGRMEQLPMNAFAGFESTLQKLWIQGTNLISVPMVMQHLKTVRELHFDNNVRVGDTGILIPAFAGFANSLTTLTLENNTLSDFPFLTFGMLHTLSLANNDIQFVRDQAIKVIVSNLTTINLQLCGLDRIPGALSMLHGVINLDFTDNQINTIENNDLQHLTNLQTLNVSNNPLKYISKSTFYDLKSLRELVLQNTYLYRVPEAITNIPSLRKLDLTMDVPNIECICETAQWLSCYMVSNNTNLVILGRCETILWSIAEYATHGIPTYCPCH